jgi:hypothetical protein
MTKREGYGKQMQHKLADWKTRLGGLTAKEGGATADQLEAWKVAGDAASAKLVEMRAAAARYGEIRAELETAWAAMEGVLPEADAKPTTRVA